MNWISWFNPIGTDTLRAAAALEGECAHYPDGDDQYEGRFDSTSFHYNDSLFYGIPGTLFYTSTINGNISEFWRSMELCGNVQEFKAYSTDQRTITNTLLSVKYQVERPDFNIDTPYGYTQVSNTLFGQKVYENEYALPWGYTYDQAVSYDSLEELNGVEKQEALIQAVALDRDYYKPYAADITIETERIPYSNTCTNCVWDEGRLECSAPNAQIVLHAELPAGKEYYVRLKGFNINGYADGYYTTSLAASFNISVQCGDVFKYSRAMAKEYPWYYGRENYLFCLGYSDTDRRDVVINFPELGSFMLNDIELYALPMDKYPARIERLREEALKDISIFNNSVSGTVDLSKPKVLCVTIPYDSGWHAYVDGQSQEIIRANYAFLGLELGEGHHDILLIYSPAGLREGFCISGLCAIILVFISTMKKRERNRA